MPTELESLLDKKNDNDFVVNEWYLNITIVINFFLLG